MPSFPALLDGTVSLWPVRRTVKRLVHVCEFTDETEQRWAEGPQLQEFELSIAALGSAALETLVTFFDTVKGGKDPFDITLAGVTYDHMILLSDTLEMTKAAGGSWSVVARCRQRRA